MWVIAKQWCNMCVYEALVLFFLRAQKKTAQTSTQYSDGVSFMLTPREYFVVFVVSFSESAIFESSSEHANILPAQCSQQGRCLELASDVIICKLVFLHSWSLSPPEDASVDTSGMNRSILFRFTFAPFEDAVVGSSRISCALLQSTCCFHLTVTKVATHDVAAGAQALAGDLEGASATSGAQKKQ